MGNGPSTRKVRGPRFSGSGNGSKLVVAASAGGADGAALMRAWAGPPEVAATGAMGAAEPCARVSLAGRPHPPRRTAVDQVTARPVTERAVIARHLYHFPTKWWPLRGESL